MAKEMGDLKYHCGECPVVEYCPSGECTNYDLCADSRFKEVACDMFIKVAQTLSFGEAPARPDCSESCDNEDCGNVDEQLLRGLATGVYAVLQKGGV